MTRVHVLAGEDEYSSHETMRTFEADLRAAMPQVDIDYRVPDVLTDVPHFPPSSFGDLSGLATSDLLVIYTRFRQLPDPEMRAIVDFVDGGGNVLGLRTSTHAFHYPEDSWWAAWNDRFGRTVLGSPWIAHHGHSSSTDVTAVRGVDHPVLAGVEPAFHVRSWLYQVDLAPGCVPVLHGVPVDPECPPVPAPVAWVHESGSTRRVTTTMGHSDDFAVPSFRRFLLNAAAWCLEGAR